jgi:hypothetical protein
MTTTLSLLTKAGSLCLQVVRTYIERFGESEGEIQPSMLYISGSMSGAFLLEATSNPGSDRTFL